MGGLDEIRMGIGAAFLVVGMACFMIEVFGVFRFKYVLNRMHAAAIGDTLGIGSSMLGLILINGANYTSLKMALVILFLWFSSPTSSHLIARLEITTNEEEGRYKEIHLGKRGKEEKK